MHLQSLSILDYKNIEQAEVIFSPKLNCFLGDNGAGKTNLLDAIYFLSFCRSFFNPVDSQNIRHENDFFMIQGKFFRNEDDILVTCGYKNGQQKQFKRNHKPYKRLSDHIGQFPLVMISPSDSSLILGGSDERRKFMDGVISQYDHSYLDALIRYNRALLQRNNLLKQFSESGSFDADTLSIYDEQLIDHGIIIYQKRKDFIGMLIPVFQEFYEFVSCGNENVKLEYSSCIDQGDFRDQLITSSKRDRITQFTNVGIHKDDLNLLLDGFPIKKLGSQGQHKTYVVALKFAQFEFLKIASEIKPILLLDDIFDKLDSNRVSKIIGLVSEDRFGQIFITDTNREHLEKIVIEVKTDHKIFRIVEGKVIN
jgi:DNA replication and repair protein RecF